jgi:hypothetical protein
MTNYYPDMNKYKLAGPPIWWLRLLNDFDNSLVIVPSRQGFYYRLAQRRKLNLPAHIVMDALFNESDTKMLARYSLVPVTTILATAHWSTNMFHELAARAPWRMGGAEKVMQAVDDQDLHANQDVQKAITENITERAKDGWKLYQSKTGQRRFIDSTKQHAWDRATPGPTPTVDRRTFRQPPESPIRRTGMIVGA